MKNNSSNGINYIKILKNAWNITWKNRFLWWFGFFAAIGGGASIRSGSFQDNSESGEELPPEIVNDISQYWSLYREWIIVAIIVLFLVVIALYILGIIGRGGLISSIVKIMKKKDVSFSIGFKAGKRMFWNLFLLNLIFGLSLFFISAVLIFPVARLLAMKAFGPAIFLGVIAISIIISFFILASFLKIFSQIYLVGNKVRLVDSIGLSYNLFKINMKSSVLMAIILILVAIVNGMLLLMTIFVLCSPFLVIGIVFYFAVGITGAISIAGLALFMLLIFCMIWNSAYTVFRQTVWILFFSQIAIAPDNEKKIEESMQENIPNLEKV